MAAINFSSRLRKLCFFSFLVFVFAGKSVLAEIKFEDTTSVSGIHHVGESFGASWGDFNGDGLPDLWASNHRYHPSLYINQGGGKFVDIASEVLFYEAGDTHGAAWGDFDNDGDQDLIELAGGGGGLGGVIWPGYSNHLYVNESGSFSEQALQHGLDYPQARGRTPTWIDWNKDGLLDVVLTSYAQPDSTGGTSLFQQEESSGFRSVNDETGFGCDKRTSYAQQADMNGDGRLEIVCHKASSFPDRIFDLNFLPFVNTVSPDVKEQFVKDSVIVDLDGDLDLDMFLARSNYIASDAISVGYRKLESKLETNGDEVGFDFRSDGDININMFMPRMTDEEIYVGANGHTPANIVHEEIPALNKSFVKFSLASGDSQNGGIVDHAPGVDKGIYFGFDSSTGVWKVRLSHSVYNLAHLQIESTAAIEDIQHVGFLRSDNNHTPVVLKNVAGELINVSTESGFTEARFCESIGAGDFDNDMDIDLYLVCSMSALVNAPNVIAENRGDGTFIITDSGFGAAGGNVPGVGETVAVADYDEDGFLDLFVANGRSGPPFSSDGKDVLYRNVGNSNNWLHIDLEGIESNRNGVGAKVYATAGGVTQLREQNGGIHRFSQDFQRVHFGLGSNAKVERLVVHWPSGIVQELENIPVNQAIKIVEPVAASIFGQPDYVPGKDVGVYLWRDAFDGPYRLRVSSDGVDSTFSIKVISDGPLQSLTRHSIENSDKIQELENGFLLTSHVAGWEDGVDFSVPHGSKVMIGIEKDGRPNPRYLHLGAAGSSVATDGWVVAVNEIGVMPYFGGGDELGFFIGTDATTQKLVSRWSGNGVKHKTSFELISSSPLQVAEGVSLEANDLISVNNSAVNIEGVVGVGIDGVDITLPSDAYVGLAYRLDGLFQERRVNRGETFGLPNAHVLPLMTPYGTPDYDQKQDKNVFLWKGQDGAWRLRLTSGQGSSRLKGVIVSDTAPINMTTGLLEPSDVLDMTDPHGIVFDFTSQNGWQDGINFEFPEGANVSIQFDQNTPVSAGPVLIGAGRWPINNLSVDLSGW